MNSKTIRGNLRINRPATFGLDISVARVLWGGDISGCLSGFPVPKWQCFGLSVRNKRSLTSVPESHSEIADARVSSSFMRLRVIAMASSRIVGWENISETGCLELSS